MGLGSKPTLSYEQRVQAEVSGGRSFMDMIGSEQQKPQPAPVVASKPSEPTMIRSSVGTVKPPTQAPIGKPAQKLVATLDDLEDLDL